MHKAIILRRYCDIPMAQSKGIIGKKYTNLERCKHDCKNCIAAIEVDENGNREHIDVRRANEKLQAQK